jgi:type I restriction enzyme, R subunit
MPPEPRVCKKCGQNPCVCEPEPCPVCGNIPCVCEKPPKQIIRVKLSEHNVRELDSMVKTRFYNPDGIPISAEEFIKRLFGEIPALFKDEEELRKIWSYPVTRKRLINELSERGYTQSQLEDLRKLIHGEDSDLFDVLSYVAYHKELVPRLERAERAKIYFDSYNPVQQDFLNFVLDQYVKVGVDELDEAKLPNILTLKYHAIPDAVEQLGSINSIRDTFIGFQEYLYRSETL